MASVEVDVSAVEVGQAITIKWRGKPVFVRRRSDKEIEEANSVVLNSLRDPENDSERTANPEVASSRTYEQSYLCVLVAGGDWSVYAFGLCPNCQCWRLRGMVLPLPRKSL